MNIQEEIENGIVDKLLFDMKLISPMVSEELEYNARQLAKEILEYLDGKNVRICKLPEVYGLVEHERLVEE